jgi:hypothetical protein
MGDYLFQVTPDSTETLSIAPQDSLPHKPVSYQEIDWMDDGSTEVYTFDDQDYFIVPIKWNILDDNDRGTIIDMYMSPDKACKLARSFLWLHPTDGYLYVVMFNGPIEWAQYPGTIFEVPAVELRVVGIYG